MKLAVFDFDSTLMDGETIDLFAKELGIEKKVSVITEMAMNGELDFFESLTKRVSFLKGLEESKINKICSTLTYNKGAKELIAYLKNKGVRVICFSGGFVNATSQGQNELGYDMHFSNTLHAKDGILTGQVGGEMMFNDSKGKMLLKLQKMLNIKPEQTMVVGDGANDLSMFKYAGKKVAFCAKNILQEQANIVINEKNLMQIAEFVWLMF